MKEDRIDNILHSLKLLDYLTTSQIRELHDLKSQRNTSRILNSMSEYLSHFREGENIYYLSAEGRARVNAEVVRKKTAHVQHYIMRNQFYIYMKCPSSWENEQSYGFKEKKDVTIHPDASFINQEGRRCFVEIDNVQKMIENRNKIKKYQEFIKSTIWGIEPIVYWVTSTETKRNRLVHECQSAKLNSKVYTISDII